MNATGAWHRARWALGIALAHVGWMLGVAGSDYFGQGPHADPINVWVVWLFAPAAVAGVAYYAAYVLGTEARVTHFAAAAASSLVTASLGFLASFLAFP